MKLIVQKPKLRTIPEQPSPIQIMISKRHPEYVKHLRYLDIIATNIWVA